MSRLEMEAECRCAAEWSVSPPYGQHTDSSTTGSFQGEMLRSRDKHLILNQGNVCLSPSIPAPSFSFSFSLQDKVLVSNKQTIRWPFQDLLWDAHYCLDCSRAHQGLKDQVIEIICALV